MEQPTEEQLQAQLIWKLNKLDAAAHWRRIAEREDSDAKYNEQHGRENPEVNRHRAALYRGIADRLEKESQQ
jgi:hypothetical protein